MVGLLMCSAGQDQAPQPGKDQEKEPQDEKDSAEKKDEDPSKEDDPWGIVPHRHDELTAAEIRWWDVKDQFWKEKVAELQDVEVRNLTFAVPMQSRHSREVVHALEDTSTGQCFGFTVTGHESLPVSSCEIGAHSGTSCRPVPLAMNQREMGGASPSWASSRHKHGYIFVQLDWKPTGGLWP